MSSLRRVLRSSQLKVGLGLASVGLVLFWLIGKPEGNILVISSLWPAVFVSTTCTRCIRPLEKTSQETQADRPVDLAQSQVEHCCAGEALPSATAVGNSPSEFTQYAEGENKVLLRIASEKARSTILVCIYRRWTPRSKISRHISLRIQ